MASDSFDLLFKLSVPIVKFFHHVFGPHVFSSPVCI
jgi:hypothetical protein